MASNSCDPFQHNDLDKQIKCNACQTKTKVASWRCGCDQFWHRCPRHRDSTSSRDSGCMKLKTRKQTPANASSNKMARTTRQVGPDSHEWLLAEDVAWDKRKRELVDNWIDEPTITLGISKINRINPSFLGPSLKRRFLDVNASACSSSSIAP